MTPLAHYLAIAGCVIVMVACTCRIDQMRSGRNRWIWYFVYALFAAYAFSTVLLLLRGQRLDWNDAAGISAVLLLVIATWQQWRDGPPPETTRDLVDLKEPTE